MKCNFKYLAHKLFPESHVLPEKKLNFAFEYSDES